MAATSTSHSLVTGSQSSALFSHLTRPHPMTSDHLQPAVVTVTSGTNDNNNSSSGNPSDSSNLRKVIIRKDERGFGLKVSGSHPVFVAHVSDGGPAARAGVRVGDKIIRVNGTIVNAVDHNQVVQMIKGNGENLVQLDLIPAPVATAPSAAAADRPVITQKPANMGGEEQPVAAAVTSVNRSASPSAASRRLSTVSGINYYQPGKHQPMIPRHLSESSGGKKGLSLTVGQTAGESVTMQSPQPQQQQQQQTSPISQPIISQPNITSPVPAPKTAQLECEKTKETIFKNYIKQEKDRLKDLIASNTQGNADEEIEKSQRSIEQWTVKLKEIRKKRRSRHKLISKNIFSPSSVMSSSQTHLIGPEAFGSRDMSESTDDLSHGIHNTATSTYPVHLYWSKSTAGPSSHPHRDVKESRKSHSFKDELFLKSKDQQILSMESDDECDDDEDAEGENEDEMDESDEAIRGPRFPANLNSKRRIQKRSKESAVVDEELSDIEALVRKLIACKKRYLQTAASSTTRSAKEKITGRRKGPSAVRSSFMSSSTTPEEIEWIGESRKLLTLISFALNQRMDINYLLFFGLGSLVQNELFEALDDACKKTGKGKGESLFELISLFLVPDESPLSLKEISPSQIELDSLRSLSDSTQDGDLLPRYLTHAKNTVNALLINSMNQTKLMGLLPSVTNIVPSSSSSSSTSLKDKKKLKEAMRKLLSDALSFEPSPGTYGSDLNQTSPSQASDFNLFPSSQVLVSHLKQLIQGAPLKGDATDAVPYSQSLARVVSLLSLFYHLLPHSIFFSSPPPELESFIMMNSIVSSRPGSASDGTAVPSGPRHKSLPSSLGSCSNTAPSPTVSSTAGQRVNMDPCEHPASRAALSASAAAGKKNSKSFISSSSSSAITTYNHSHVMANPTFSVLSEVIWCTSCSHLLWGKTMFSLNCVKCKLRCHSWCFFTSINGNVDYPCVPLNPNSPSVPSALAMIASPTTGLPLSGPPLGLPYNLASVKPASEGRRSFFVTSYFKSNQSKLSSASDLAKISGTSSSSIFYPQSLGESSSSSLDLSSSSSSSSEDEDSEENENVSASSDPSTPILGSAKHSRKGKNIKKTKRSKSLEEGVTSANVESATESKSKEFEQALEEEEKEKRLMREKRRKKLRQRKFVVNEFLKVEKSYGNKLRLLHFRFFEPISITNLLTKEETTTIFSNLHQLLEIHMAMQKQLIEKIKPILSIKRNKIDWKQVGDLFREIFLSIGRRLEDEVAHFSSGEQARHELLNAKSKSSKFTAFLSEAEKSICDTKKGRLSLKALLAEPWQRVTRYELILKSLYDTFPNPSQSLIVDPIDAGKTDVKMQQILVRELEARESIESAWAAAKSIAQGVNRRKTEFEFLVWFRHKIAPFYSKPNNLTPDSIRLLHEGPVNWKISRPTAVPSYLLLLKDLLLILTADLPNPASVVMSSSSSTSSLAPLPPASVSSSPSAAVSSSSAAFTFSFLSEKLRSVEAATSTVYSLKIPSAADADKQPGVTVNPVLEITPDLETRPTATIRTAFFLFSKGISSSSTVTSGHKSKDVEAKAAMYELITPSEKEREEWTGNIQELAISKNSDKPAAGLSRESSISSFQRSISTNPFHWSQEQEQEQISRNRNRPLPPLPISTSVTSGLSVPDKKKSQKMSSMKRSKSQEGSKTNLSDVSAPTDPSSKVVPPASAISSHSREPSDSDLPPIVGHIERVPPREPLNNFSEAVSVTGPPDVRYAQRITVRGSHYANDSVWSSDNCGDDCQQAYEEVDSFDDSRLQENLINQKILTLLEERKKLLSSKSSRSLPAPDNVRDATADLVGLGLDAFRLELLTQSRHANTDRKENEMNDLRLKLIRLLTL